MDIAALGKEPVSLDSPAGSDARYDPEFEELQAEMDKLSSPTASGELNWDRVNTLCQSILSGKAKDILVASYFSVAQIQLRKLEGFALGLKVYRDLLENFWDGLFPPKKRIKGRIAAIAWWLEKNEAAMEKIAIDPQPREVLEELRHDLKAIQSVLDEQLQDPPLLRPLERIIERIPAHEEQEAAVPSPPSRPEMQETLQEAAPPPSKKDRPQPEPAQFVQPESIASSAEAEKALRSAFKHIQFTADQVGQLAPTDPRPYRWRRMAGWAMIQDPPPATEGRSQIPPPPELAHVVSSLQDLQAKGNWQALLNQAEDRLSGAVLWLDLNRFSAEALSNLGEGYQSAHEAVCRETASFVLRVPGLSELAYADGTPLADPETRQWLKDIQPAGGGGASPSAPAESSPGLEEKEDTLQQAEALTRKRKLPEAVSLIQHKMQACSAGKDRLAWRIGLARLLMRSSSGLTAPHLELILKDIDRFSLEEWDPGLALEGLTTVFRGVKAGKDHEASREILTRIARLDPFQALQLGQ